MDIKLHATEQQMGQRRHQKVKKKKNTLRQMKMEMQHINPYVMKQKQF